MKYNVLVAVGLIDLAATAVSGQAIRAPRPLSAPVAISGEVFSTVQNARALPGGLVLVNDAIRHRVVLLDSALKFVRVVVDSANNPANYYGARPGGLIPYKSDSTLFVDAGDLTMMVIDPKGNIARVMSVPNTQDASALTVATAAPGLDGAGRLVYRSNVRMVMQNLNPKALAATVDRGTTPAVNGAPAPSTQPDSTALQRVDIATRKVDTAAFIRVPKSGMTVTQSAGGGIMMTSQLNPMPLLDEWAVTPDGAIAIVRGQDYHVDWITPDGKMASSPKVAFDWQRLTDDGKTAFIDSAKKAREAASTNGTQTTVSGGSAPMVLNSMLGGGGQPTVTGKTVVTGGGGGAGQVMTFGNGGGVGAPQTDFIPAADLPDYRPAFGAGAVRADRDGNIWVLTSAPVKGGGPIYDVIDRKGALVDRVQLDVGRTVVGFGPGGVLYLLARTDLGTHLERAKAR